MLVRFFNTYEPVVTLYRDLFPALLEKGHEVEAVISDSEYRNSGVSLSEHFAEVEGVTITTIRSPYNKAGGKLSKLLISLSYMLGAGFRAFSGPRGGVNVFLTQPPFFAVVGALAKRIRSKKYACVLMDIYPDVLVADGALRKNSMSASLLNRVKRMTWVNADLLIVIGRCMREKVLDVVGSDSKLVVIPNWYDDSVIDDCTEDRHRFEKEYGLEGKLVLMYSGNMGTAHHYKDLLEIAHRMSSNPDFVILVVGGGSKQRELKAATEAECIKNIVFAPFVPIEELGQCLRLADIHYICLDDKFLGSVVPSKTYSAMASGRPIIYSGDPSCEIGMCVTECDCGVAIKQGDADGLLDAVLRYQDDIELREKHGFNARIEAKRKYSQSVNVERYVEALELLV